MTRPQWPSQWTQIVSLTEIVNCELLINISILTEKPTPAKVVDHPSLKPVQVPPIVGAVGAVGPVTGVTAGTPQEPSIPAPGAPGAAYGMYPFYGQPSPYLMAQDPLTGKPLAGGPQGPTGGSPQGPAPGQVVGGMPQPQTGGPGQPPVNLCDYKGAKEQPPLDLMTKQPVDLNTGAPPPTGGPQQHPQLMGQGPPPTGGSGEPTSPMKEYPVGLTAASLAAQQHQQQAKVLSHYYPYK